MLFFQSGAQSLRLYQLEFFEDHLHLTGQNDKLYVSVFWGLEEMRSFNLTGVSVN
jgi:hypothetical protein